MIKKLEEIYSKRFEREINPLKNILVTLGANGSLSSFINGIVNEGDEVVTIEPCFPMYIDHVSMAGGVFKSAKLDYIDGKYKLDLDSLRAALSPKTKLFLFNNPHNPTGKNFSLEEV